MIYGHPPYLECSSQGDRRFSAFHARPRSLGGRSIEEAYQAMKVLGDGRTGLSWREAKGLKPVNLAECKAAYEEWWGEWIKQENLMPVLLKASGLSDVYAQRHSVNQAEVLWRLRFHSIGSKE